MKIGVTGVTGFIGRRVAALARDRGHAVIGFTRSAAGALPICDETRRVTAAEPPDCTGCDAIIHLAGEPVVGRWTAAKKRRIRASRVDGTRRVVEGIAAGASGRRPAVLVSGSAVGYYGDTGDRTADESWPSAPVFLGELVRDWEAAAMAATAHGVRVALVRTGLVLGPGGGALGPLLPLFRLGLGARVGSGRQWLSWIHRDDEAALLLFAVENAAATGPLNGCAPEPVRNADFTRALARAVRRPAPWIVPGWALRLLLGGFAAELLDSRRVVPRRPLELGFRHRFPDLAGALADAGR